MKVLMLHDCAHVGHELTKELVNIDVDVTLLQYHNRLGFNFTKGINLLRMLIACRRSNCDLIHAHFLGAAATVAYYSRKPYIIHVHGSDVRNRKLSSTQKKALKKASAIIYATPDLKQFLPQHAIYLETPVGKQFKNMHKKRHIKSAYRTVKYETSEHPVELLIEGIPYEDMPNLLNTIDMFIDRHTIDSLSKTALEALACGCTVKNGIFHMHGLPEKHKASNVAKKLKGIYTDVIHA